MHKLLYENCTYASSVLFWLDPSPKGGKINRLSITGHMSEVLSIPN